LTTQEAKKREEDAERIAAELIAQEEQERQKTGLTKRKSSKT